MRKLDYVLGRASITPAGIPSRICNAVREELAAAVKMTPPLYRWAAGKVTTSRHFNVVPTTTLCLGALSDTHTVPARHDGNFATAAALDEVHLAPINGGCVRLCCGFCGKLKVSRVSE